MSFRNNKSVNSVEEILNCINEYCENNSIVKDTKIKPLSEFEINNLPKLPKDWKWVISNDISTFITNGVHSPTSSEDKLGINKKMLRITDLKDNVEPDFEDLPYCKRFVKGDYDKNIKKNDIYISFTGNILGKRYIVKETREDVVFAHYFVRWQPIVVNPYYIYYVLLSDHFDRFMYENTLGSTQPNLKVTALKRVPLPLAPLDEQNRIATFFNNIDMKIQVNNQINKTLENMAQTIFKHWFVDFEFPNEDGEPYRSSGGEMVESELGMIPKGWKVSTVGELTEIVSKGTTPRKSDIDSATDPNCVKFLKVKDISDHGVIDLTGLEMIPYSVHLNQLKRSILKYKDVLISIAGTIGRVSYVNEELINANTNQAVAFIRLKDVDKHFLLMHYKFKSSNFQDSIKSKIVQGVQANISLSVIRDEKLILPDDNVLGLYNNVLNNIFNESNILYKEINSLTNIRDTLIPKLMSGEIRVPLDEDGDAL